MANSRQALSIASASSSRSGTRLPLNRPWRGRGLEVMEVNRNAIGLAKINGCLDTLNGVHFVLSTNAWQFWARSIGRVCLLFLRIAAISRHAAARPTGTGKVMPDMLVQFPQVIAWNRGVHMVFRVIVHMPVEKADERFG